jgi:hypothetical protein
LIAFSLKANPSQNALSQKYTMVKNINFLYSEHFVTKTAYSNISNDRRKAAELPEIC